MTIDLPALLAAARTVDPTVIGLRLVDPEDPETWIFERDRVRTDPLKPRTWRPAAPLTKTQTAALRAAVDDVRRLEPTDPSPTMAPISPEDVLGWCAKKLGVDPVEAAVDIRKDRDEKEPAELGQAEKGPR